MKTLAHLKPGQRGTKKLLAQYGTRLVCVRYRYDAQAKKRFTTVELIVSEGAWEPPPHQPAAETVVSIRVALQEVALRQRVKRAGSRWNAVRRVWELRYDRVLALGLEERIVSGESI
jgi:hypothetical protein